MHTLIIDTSGRFTTAAMTKDRALVGCVTLEAQPLTHLHGEILRLAERLALEIGDVGRLGVVTGPGSWTGLNIGVTAAKTLAQVLEVGVVELSSLDALVAAERWSGGRVHALLDAKRGNVYCASYATDAAGRVEAGTAPARVLAWRGWCETLERDGGRPLVVEYGDVFRDRLGELSEICRRNRPFLTAEGLLAALLAREDGAVTGAEAMAVAPRYMQRLV